jgi:hypothetical protein
MEQSGYHRAGGPFFDRTGDFLDFLNFAACVDL